MFLLWTGFDEYPLPDPTRTFFLLPEPDPNYFSTSPSIGFFPAGCFPVDCFKPFTIILKFCCFLVVPTRNPLFLNQNVLDTRDESKESQKNLTIDLWCILIYSIQVKTAKSINQKGDSFLSEAPGLKQPQVILHKHEVLHLLRIQLDPLGLDARFFGTTLFFWMGGMAVG